MSGVVAGATLADDLGVIVHVSVTFGVWMHVGIPVYVGVSKTQQDDTPCKVFGVIALIAGPHLCMALRIVLTTRTKPNPKDRVWSTIQKTNIIMSTIAFVIWTYSQGVPYDKFGIFNATASVFAVSIFSVIAALINLMWPSPENGKKR